jgi:Mn2+/Fe2+ NRAMP family transporter
MSLKILAWIVAGVIAVLNAYLTWQVVSGAGS